MLTHEEFVKGTEGLNKMNFSFEQGGMIFETFWNRIYTDGEYNWNYKEHRHSFYELHICMSGECSMIIGGESIKLLPGTFLVISPKKPHKIDTVSKDFSKLVLGIKIEPKNKSCAFALKLFGEGNDKPKLRRTTDKMLACIDEMVENANSRLFNYYDIIKIRLYCLIIHVMRQTSNIKNFGSSMDGLNSDARIDAIKDFIKDNLAQKFTNESIARQFNISSRQLNRILQDTVGMSMGDFKRSIRVDVIREYLKNTDLSLKEIANLTGFYDEFSLSKVFKRVDGMPPGEYRKGFKA